MIRDPLDILEDPSHSVHIELVHIWMYVRDFQNVHG